MPYPQRRELLSIGVLKLLCQNAFGVQAVFDMWQIVHARSCLAS